jgi:hypothetical protein
MKDYCTLPSQLADSAASAHLKAGSTLSEFMAGRLGAPSCWPAGVYRTNGILHPPNELSSIQRWENEGGKTVAAAATAKSPMSALQYFHPPLTAQLI